MAYGEEAFIKSIDNVKAPKGFHYKPDGGIAKDADYLALYGYIEKEIKDVIIDYSDISPDGGLKAITIIADEGAVFSIETYEGDRVNYYNFKTKTWSAIPYKRIYAQVGAGGSYATSVILPQQTSLKTITINIIAETVENIRTRHVALSEARYLDGSPNVNGSTGSNSNIITKILYQDVIKNLYISTASPSKTSQSTATTNGAVSSNRMILDEDATDPNVVEIGDLIECTGISGGLGTLVTKINPDGDNIHEIEMSEEDVVGDGVAVTFYPAFRGMIPNNISSTTGRAAIEVVSGSSGKHEFSITLAAVDSRGFSSIRTPVTDDLCFINSVTFGAEASPIAGEDISGSTYYRWPITNIANLTNGMELDPSRSGSGGNTTTPTTISNYVVNKTIQELDESNRYYTDVESSEEEDVFVRGIVSTGFISSIDRNGRVQAQAGDVVFDVQQLDALKADADVLVIAQGAGLISKATGMSVAISDTVVTPTQVSTTTTAASSASATIAMTEVGNILVGQTVRGVGIGSTTANPTVVSKSAPTGAANIVVSSAQTLEDGITLYFDGPSNELLITGTIDVRNMPITDTTLYLNVEGFLVAG